MAVTQGMGKVVVEQRHHVVAKFNVTVDKADVFAADFNVRNAEGVEPVCIHFADLEGDRYTFALDPATSAYLVEQLTAAADAAPTIVLPGDAAANGRYDD